LGKNVITVSDGHAFHITSYDGTSVCVMSASTFAGVVVVAIANLKPALRASLNKRAAPQQTLHYVKWRAH
jgi:S-adenosylhomocysteine hydrolase